MAGIEGVLDFIKEFVVRVGTTLVNAKYSMVAFALREIFESLCFGHDGEDILVVKSFGNPLKMLLFGFHHFVFDVPEVVCLDILSDLVTDLLEVLQDAHPFVLSDAVALAFILRLVAKDYAHVESAVVGADKSFIDKS